MAVIGWDGREGSTSATMSWESTLNTINTYVVQPGDVITSINMYVAAESPAGDALVPIQIYDLDSGDALVASVDVPVSATPGLYTLTTSIDLSAYVGHELAIAHARAHSGSSYNVITTRTQNGNVPITTGNYTVNDPFQRTAIGSYRFSYFATVEQGGGTGTDVLPSTAHSVSLSRSPRVATGARIDATIAQSSSQAFAPVPASGASVTPSAGRSASQGLNPSVELGAVVHPTLARSASRAFSPGVVAGASVWPSLSRSTSEARTPSVFTVVTVRPTVARSLSRARNPSLGSDAFVRKHTLNAAVLNPKPQLYGLLQRRHTL